MNPRLLDGFARKMAQVGDGATGETIAERLHRCLLADRDALGAPIRDIHGWANNVEFEIEASEFARFTIECHGADAFRLYPAVRRGDDVVWLNVWVRDDMTSEELVDSLNEEVARVGTRAD